MVRRRRASSVEGVREYVLVTAFLALAVAGVLILFGDDLRGALGLGAAAPPPSEQQ